MSSYTNSLSRHNRLVVRCYALRPLGGRDEGKGGGGSNGGVADAEK